MVNYTTVSNLSSRDQPFLTEGYIYGILILIANP